MNILIVIDKEKSAIDILSQKIKEYNPHFNIDILPVHPKKNNDQLKEFEKYGQQADIIHFQYWKSAEMLKECYPWIGNKKTILTHHNPYDVNKQAWNYDKIVVKNTSQQRDIPKAKLIPHTVDFKQFWHFDKPDTPFSVGMVAGRIESSKGILEVAQACKKLGCKFILVGRISDRDYFKSIQQTGVDLDFKEDISVGDLILAYHQMSVVVINSKDNFESGPLIILEALACGTPVITRMVGLVEDIYDGTNLLINESKKEDVKELTRLIKIMEDPGKRKQLANNGFFSIAGNIKGNRHSEVSARMYSSLYYETACEDDLVSIVIPTCNRPDNWGRILASIQEQTYKDIEVVVADNSDNDETGIVLANLESDFKYPIKYIKVDHKGYGLAKARNMGTIEAEGKYIMYMDDRFVLEEEAIEQLKKEVKFNTWVYGVKDENFSRGFIENFSMVLRSVVVRAGMFCERMEYYGGMSQEIRERMGRQGIMYLKTGHAKATSISSSTSWKERRGDLVNSKLLCFKLYG